MKRSINRARALRGELRVPGDKSISHRAAIFNAIASGTARIDNYLAGADCLSTLACLRALGVEWEPIASDNPRGLSLSLTGRRRLAEPDDLLPAGNSGTTLRLLTGLLAGQSLFAILSGDTSLRSRPMARVVDPLRLMGAQIDGRGNGRLAPLAIRGGGLQGIEYDLPVASAQVKSALLLAGLQADGETTLVEPAKSRDHSERMLAAMGLPLTVDGTRLQLTGPTDLVARDVHVPGDISSAAFWLVAAAVHPDAEICVRQVGVNPTRTGIVDVLSAMGARITLDNLHDEAGEPVADLIVRTSALSGVEIGGEMIPRLIDEIPVLAVAAAFAEGTTVIRDAAELRVKESDRIATLAEELRRFGVAVEESPDGLAVHGGRWPTGAACESHGDHRLAMALAVAGMVADGETSVEGAEAVEVSYPGFWEDLARLASGT